MSDVVVMRVDFAQRQRDSRDLEERLMVRFPRVWRAVTAIVFRLFSPRSRLKRALLRRQVVSGFAAFNRRDWEVVLVRYAPDAEREFSPGISTLGFTGPLRGYGATIEAFAELDEAGRWDVIPAAAVDMGDRLVVLGTVRVRSRTSGVEVEQELAQVLTLRGGLVVHEYSGPMPWEDALRAAGLDPRDLAPELRRRTPMLAPR